MPRKKRGSFSTYNTLRPPEDQSVYDEFARRLEARMTALGLNQSELARKCTKLLPAKRSQARHQNKDFGRDRISRYIRVNDAAAAKRVCRYWPRRSNASRRILIPPLGVPVAWRPAAGARDAHDQRRPSLAARQPNHDDGDGHQDYDTVARRGRRVTLDELAKELKVTRRTIHRLMRLGHITPSRYEKSTKYGKRGRHIFDCDYVEGLTCRANEARSRGSKYAMGALITSTGTTQTPSPPELSASAWARQTRWKRRNATRHSSPEVTLASALAELLG